ncbi:hypothetical protein [Myxococcus sp. AS-1-15]|uniref:hypothetical protein n=1 Tax=Myxococcus sp. AS-1-15 TaxID=2874600 RepID=UPI001CBEB581|nr:hypothetical protein [Myxococcus sp. AS-1-15]MBZ4400390.1 hypothetical protein [Myxococcus sp. AS-1-15]
MTTCRAPRRLLYRETKGPEGRRVTIQAEGLPSVLVDAATSDAASTKAFAEVGKHADAAGLGINDFTVTMEFPPEEVLS